MIASLKVSPDLLAGEVALVTGAGRGNGLAMARGLASAGASVAIADIDPVSAEAAAAAIAERGAPASAHGLDVADAEACRRVAADIEARLGPVSILVNNAGILVRDALEAEGFEASWDLTWRVNVQGVTNMTRACLPQLRRRAGRIVNVGSIMSFRGTANASAYVTSKGAVLQMTRSLAAELAPDGIRVNGIAPGRFATAMTEAYRDDPAVKSAYFARTPMQRYGEPEDLVGPVLFLASSWSGYVTGIMLPVDGGFLVT